MEPVEKIIRYSGSARSRPTRHPKTLILAVNDDRRTLLLLEQQLIEKGHDVITARDGYEAITFLHARSEEIDVVVLDREMPGMDGLSVVRLMKKDDRLRHIPVIMQTGSDRAQEIREGINAGVFYYLTQPLENDVLESVLAAALRDMAQERELRRQISHQRDGFRMIENCRFRLSTLDEAESLAVFLASAYPDPHRAVVGLLELLVNAIEHGNVGVGYAAKTTLVGNGTWREEVMRRTKLPEHAEKAVEVMLQTTPQSVLVQITDQGNGFDWQRYLAMDPARATDNHGRGIAQANLHCFDALRYNEKGNQVLAVMHIPQA